MSRSHTADPASCRSQKVIKRMQCRHFCRSASSSFDVMMSGQIGSGKICRRLPGMFTLLASTGLANPAELFGIPTITAVISIPTL